MINVIEVSNEKQVHIPPAPLPIFAVGSSKMDYLPQNQKAPPLSWRSGAYR